MYIQLNKGVHVERYTINRFFLCISNTEEKYIINDSSYEIIIRLDGNRTYEEVVQELAELYKDNIDNIKLLVNEFLDELKSNYGLELVCSEKKSEERIKIVGEVCCYPKAASLEITECCNLNCLHCYGSFGDKCTNVMSLENVKRILGDLDEIGVTNIELTGGDVSTYGKLWEVINYALSLSFGKIYVLTNGIVLKEDVIDLIVSNRERVEVQIDLHSLDDEYLAWFTGCKDTIEIIKNRISYFTEKGVNMRVATIFTSKNINEFKNIAVWVSSKKVHWGIGLVEKLGRANTSDEALYLDYNQLIQFQQLVSEAIEMYPGMISVIDYQPNDCNCGAMTTHVVIDSYGKIKLCTMDNGLYFDNKMGNCLEKTIKEIFDDNIRFVEKLTKYYLPDGSCQECSECQELYACGRCMLRHFINLKERNFECEWYKNNVPEEIKRFFFEDTVDITRGE